MTTGVRNSSFKPKAVGDFKGGGVPLLREAGAGPDAAAGGLLRGLQEPGARRACGGSASGRSASYRVYIMMKHYVHLAGGRRGRWVDEAVGEKGDLLDLRRPRRMARSPLGVPKQDENVQVSAEAYRHGESLPHYRRRPMSHCSDLPDDPVYAFCPAYDPSGQPNRSASRSGTSRVMSPPPWSRSPSTTPSASATGSTDAADLTAPHGRNSPGDPRSPESTRAGRIDPRKLPRGSRRRYA